MKRKLNLNHYKYYLEATQSANKINHLEKYEIDINRLRSEKHHIFTEKINKIALSLNDDKSM